MGGLKVKLGGVAAPAGKEHTGQCPLTVLDTWYDNHGLQIDGGPLAANH